MKRTLLNSKLAASALATVVLAITGCFEDHGTVVDQGSTQNGGYSVSEPEVQQPPVTTPSEPEPGTSGPGTGTDLPSDPPPMLGIIIQGQPKSVRDPHVTAEIQYGGWTRMKLGFTEDCSDGAWESPVGSRDLELKNLNAQNVVSVQFSDEDLFARSECYKAHVIHDDQGPHIVFKSYPPPSVEEGVAEQIVYEVTDVSGVSAVTCDFLGAQKACPAGTDVKVNITALPEGDYQFTLVAQDTLGNTSNAAVSWKVVSTTKHLVQKLSLNDYRKVDILMVIDNSGSMEYEQRNMAERTSNLLSVLRGLDWQIGITTTDPRNVTKGDGRLLELSGLQNQYILKSSMNETQAQSILSNTLQRPEEGSGSEQGIYVTYRALERSLDSKDPASGLIRQGAHFATVVISDEDESANGAKNDPNNLIQFIADTFGQKNFSFNSIITIPGDTQCRKTYGAAYGDRYKKLSDLTGGVIGSVCASDYASQVSGIAQEIRNLLKVITLQCEPIQTMPLTISVNGAPLGLPFRVEGVNLKFDQELPPGDYVVDYHCLK